jgi:hypothetical protein
VVLLPGFNNKPPWQCALKSKARPTGSGASGHGVGTWCPVQGLALQHTAPHTIMLSTLLES